MSEYPTPGDVSAATKRVQALSPDARDWLTYGLVGRMLVSNWSALREDLENAEQLDAKMRDAQNV